MQKLQELITKNKEKLRDGNDIKSVLCSDGVIIHERIKTNKIYSLSDLLFSTPFLSLLSWDDSKCDATRTKQHIKNGTFIEGYSIYESYHKINLALLESDKERVEYIESFTL